VNVVGKVVLSIRIQEVQLELNTALFQEYVILVAVPLFQFQLKSFEFSFNGIYKRVLAQGFHPFFFLYTIFIIGISFY
jgi:hypothetical protein